MKLQIYFIYCLTTIGTEVVTQANKPLAACSAGAYLVDRRCPELRHAEAAIDTHFDRIVAIVLMSPRITVTVNNTSKRVPLGRNEAIGTGVLITNRLILSSFNAFLTLSHRNDSLKRLRAFIINSRRFRGDSNFYYSIQLYNTTMIDCARQVLVQNKKEPVPDHMRHGIHNPLHDLMVFRVAYPAKFADPIPPRRYDFNDYQRHTVWHEPTKTHEWSTGPIRTKLARPGDMLGDDIRWASMGHIDDEHIRLYRFLEIGKISLGEKVITNCDAWIPREWGHFICIFNKHNYPGLASGGVLFSDDVLFGIGSFALFKRQHSILVFTDVRPYWHLFYRTCSFDDQRLVIPK